MQYRQSEHDVSFTMQCMQAVRAWRIIYWCNAGSQSMTYHLLMQYRQSEHDASFTDAVQTVRACRIILWCNNRSQSMTYIYLYIYICPGVGVALTRWLSTPCQCLCSPHQATVGDTAACLTSAWSTEFAYSDPVETDGLSLPWRLGRQERDCLAGRFVVQPSRQHLVATRESTRRVIVCARPSRQHLAATRESARRVIVCIRHSRQHLARVRERWRARSMFYH